MRGLSAFCETVNEKTMTEEIKKISILCVQMNGESRDVMKQVWEDLEIADKTFYDNIGDIQPNEIFVQWDGRANKARVYLAAMHQQFPKVPTFLLMGRDLIAEERELTKKVKVHDIFNIPFDAIKIRTYFFNKYGNHEEEEEGETGESASAEASSSAETDAAGAQPAGPGRTPQEAKAASGASPAPVRSPAKPKKIKTAEMITAPMGLSDITVIDKVKEAFHRAAQPPEGGGIKDGIEYISNQEVLFFDTDVAAIPGFEKQIQTFGFSNVRGFIDPQAILTKLRQGRGQAIFLWYTGQFRAPGELLQEIVEMRDLHRMYLILFIPGEEAVRKFVANFPHLPVDGLILRGHKKGIIVEKLNELWDEKSATQKFIQTLHGLRENWRNNRYNIPRKGISEKMLTEAKALIESNPHKAYLIHAELMSQEILKGNKEGIKSYFELFKPFMGKSYDAVIQYAIAKASTENTENATTWLMREGMGFHFLGREKLNMTIKLLIKWKQLDAAKNLILRWQERKDLANDADLHHLIAMYHQKLGNDKDEINHLKYAIGLDPLMIDSIVALAESLERRGVLRMATRLWEILAKADLAVTANFKYRYLRCMVNDNNVREAKKELEAFYPGGITDEATRLLFADLQKTG